MDLSVFYNEPIVILKFCSLESPKYGNTHLDSRVECGKILNRDNRVVKGIYYVTQDADPVSVKPVTAHSTHSSIG